MPDAQGWSASDGSAEPGLCFDARVALGAFTLEASFRVAPGENLVLVGPSGSGKTTCLALAAGLLRPDRARITLDGRALCDTDRGVDLPPERRRLGLLFQDYALFPHLTVFENVAYGARLRLGSRRKVGAVVAEWLERLGIGDQAGHRVSALSGGQRQRVALARAVAARPAALLLDEPLGALDVATRSTVRTHLVAFLQEVGLPTVVVTHDPVDALVFGHRIVVLEKGRITQSGDRDDLLRHPRGDLVAEMAGLNLYRANLAPGEGLKEARVGDAVFHVLAAHLAGDAYLAFSPAEVALFDERPAGSAQNVFAGKVTEVVPLPDRLRVLLDVGVSLSADVTREAAAALGLEPGRRVWAAVKAAAIRVYT